MTHTYCHQSISGRSKQWQIISTINDVVTKINLFSVDTAYVTQNKRLAIWQLCCNHNDNLRWHQWWQSGQIDDLLFSVILIFISTLFYLRVLYQELGNHWCVPFNVNHAMNFDQRARDTIYTILTSVQLGPWWWQATSHCLSQYICSNVGILKLMFTWKCFQLLLPMNIWTTFISKTWFSHINSNNVFLLKLNYIGFSWIIVTLTLAISSVTLCWHGGNVIEWKF